MNSPLAARDFDFVVAWERQSPDWRTSPQPRNASRRAVEFVAAVFRPPAFEVAVEFVGARHAVPAVRAWERQSPDWHMWHSHSWLCAFAFLCASAVIFSSSPLIL